MRDISFLDPCCGSMHFGLVAFDIFAEMYREELENAGKPGWPAKPSAATEEEIPGSIVAHNLFGIDSTSAPSSSPRSRSSSEPAR